MTEGSTIFVAYVCACAVKWMHEAWQGECKKTPLAIIRYVLLLADVLNHQAQTSGILCKHLSHQHQYSTYPTPETALPNKLLYIDTVSGDLKPTFIPSNDSRFLNPYLFTCILNTEFQTDTAAMNF